MKKSTKTGLDSKAFNDSWASAQEDLKALASEQVHADIELVNSTNALKQAQERQAKAIARKTQAEKRLNTVRSNLGA